MGDKSGIQWTDATWNPVTGCEKISPGCAHCYAETVALRFWKAQYPPIQVVMGTRPRVFTDVQCHEERLLQPLRWQRPRMIFVNSMSDLFHDSVPDEFIDRVFAVMFLAKQHTFQVLTKRSKRMRAYMETRTAAARWKAVAHQLALFGDVDGVKGAHEAADAMMGNDAGDVPMCWPLPNVWLGVSAESQRFADERIPDLQHCPARVRWVSYEPALGPVNFRRYVEGQDGPPLDWIVMGGESESDRPCDRRWFYHVLLDTAGSAVALYVKQLGAHSIIDGSPLRLALKHKKGGDIAEFPPDLRIRNYPTTLNQETTT